MVVKDTNLPWRTFITGSDMERGRNGAVAMQGGMTSLTMLSEHVRKVQYQITGKARATCVQMSFVAFRWQFIQKSWNLKQHINCGLI